jgi:predicted nucleotidyltransferase
MSIGHVNPELAKKLPLDRIAELCRKYYVVELSIFGSFLRDDFGPESDIDLLVIFQDDDYGPWMGKLLQMEDELSALLGRKVDLVPKESIERSENWIRRNRILDTAQVIYG